MKALIAFWRVLFPWRYDERNPARRYCKECGTRQELYGMNFAEGFVVTGWETMCPVHPCSRNHGDIDATG